MQNALEYASELRDKVEQTIGPISTGVLIGLSPGTESLGNAGCVGIHLHLHI
jgi:hypothetical protein